MSISILDIFSISIGPSSSHTAGPMRAACAFVTQLLIREQLNLVTAVQIDLYGSLALTGKGHQTDKAILIGLEGNSPETIQTEIIKSRVDAILTEKKMLLANQQEISFDFNKQFLWHYAEVLPLHTNGMRFTAFDANKEVLFTEVYYSVGGGFVVTETNFNHQEVDENKKPPFPFYSASELQQFCIQNKMTISEIVLANEKTWRTEKEIREALLNIDRIMEKCIQKGCHTEGTLEGVLKLERRAPELYKKLSAQAEKTRGLSLVMNWVNTYALAVAEENAAGGKIVTAPTNGAAGVIPAVLHYYKEFCDRKVTDDDVINFLLVAGAIAILYKLNASISGAEVGCQGEVGVACSMAAGALTAVLGGDNQQIEKAAEIAMEHNLGLTCDPVAGLVQIPCIERNAIAAVKAINASMLALMEGGAHRVSLDEVIKTMLKTGQDMRTSYKETSLGGLAVNVAVC